VFHDTRDRFGGSNSDTRVIAPHALESSLEVAKAAGMGVFFPWRLDSIEPSDTPVATFSFVE
jgi:hypothetical protein